MFLTLFLGVCVITTVLWYFRAPKHIRDAVDKLPGPKAYPVIGNALQIKNGHEWIIQVLEMAETYRSDGLGRLWVANKPVCGLFKPEHIEVLLRSTKHIEKADEYDFLHPWLGTGLLTSTGDKWRHRRKMLTPTFHFNILHDFVHVFNQQSHVLVDKWRAKCGKGQFDAFQDITHCALDIICETAMGKCINAQSKDSDYVKAIYRMSYFLDLRMRRPWFKYDFLYNIIGHGKEQSEMLKILHDLSNSIIADRLKNFDKKRSDIIEKELSEETSIDIDTRSKNKRLVFLDLLLYMSDNLTKLSIEDIREEVDTFMFEGHDTTAAAMSWAIYLLGENPRVQVKLQEELDNVFGNDNRDPTMEDLKNLKYLECCIKEALRIFPSVPLFARKLKEEIQFGKFTVPEGVSVIVAPIVVHRDPEIYPEPDAYKPERFLPDNFKNRHPYSYIPFSAGSRNCIGQKFALLEEKTVLSHIFRNFSVKSKQERSQLRPVGDIILRPEKAILIELEPRSLLK